MTLSQTDGHLHMVTTSAMEGTRTTAGDTWGTGSLLCYSGLDGQTPYETALVIRTLAGDAVALDVCLPGTARIHLGAGMPVRALVGSDWFGLTVGGCDIRGRFLDAHHLVVDGPCRVTVNSASLCCVCEGDATVVAVRCAFNPDWVRLHRALPFPRHGLAGPAARVAADLDAGTGAAYGRALAVMRGQVCSPQGRIRHRWTTPDRWPHRDLWLWDSAFHAIGWRHVDPAMARDALSAVFDGQGADGFIPHQARPGWQSAITQPPVLAYAATLVNDVAPAREWVAALYPGMCAYLEWNLAHRDRDGGGLLEWEIEGDPHCRSGESGMDNSPRFDGAALLDATDFNALMANEYDCVAAFADILGEPGAERWRGRAAMLRGRINALLWDDTRGFYFDRDPATGGLTDVWACAGFLPLLCGAPDARMARRMAAHLERGGVFDTPLPVASVAPLDPAYGTDMWRGPSWLNVSWLIAEGLDRYGHHGLAMRIRRTWMATLVCDYRRAGTFFEYYDSQDEVAPGHLLRKGKNGPAFPHHAIRDFGWTVTLFVDWCHRWPRLTQEADAPVA